jgi:hypothetical protein
MSTCSITTYTEAENQTTKSMQLEDQPVAGRFDWYLAVICLCTTSGFDDILESTLPGWGYPVRVASVAGSEPRSICRGASASNHNFTNM